MITVAGFRDYFPEFKDTARFPDTQIQRNLDLSSRLLRESVWGELYDDGIAYLTAHNIALMTPPAGAGAASGAIGVPSGVVSSKAVGSVSKSYDTSVGLDASAGLYGATTYGRQYFQWLGLFGAGGIQL